MTYGGVAVNAVRTVIPAGPARAQAGSGNPEITITAATQWASPGELMYTAKSAYRIIEGDSRDLINDDNVRLAYLGGTVADAGAEPAH